MTVVLCGGRVDPEHVQPVADAHVLQLAQPGVELSQRGVGLGAVRFALVQQTRLARALQDQGGDHASAARVERLCLREFVEQGFQLARRAVRARFDERRREMADRHRADPALGLRGLAGIVDDERIDHRHGPSVASAAQSRESATALPGSHSSVPCAPRWMSASMRSISRSRGRTRHSVARREREVVVLALARVGAPTIGLHGHDQLSDAQDAERERAVPRRRVGRRIAPGREYTSPERLGQSLEAPAVIGEGNDRLRSTPERCAISASASIAAPTS